MIVKQMLLAPMDLTMMMEAITMDRNVIAMITMENVVNMSMILMAGMTNVWLLIMPMKALHLVLNVLMHMEMVAPLMTKEHVYQTITLTMAMVTILLK